MKKAKVSPEELSKAIDIYFQECEEENIFPDEAGMIIFLEDNLSISSASYRRYADAKEDDEKETYKELAKVISRARDRRESWLTRRMVTDNKAAQGCFNALKQPKNGGYTDGKGNNDGQATITLKIEGIGGGASFG